MDIFHMSDIIPLIGLPYPPYGRSNYNVPCPCCDDEPHAKHLNINLQKDVFRCPRCGFSGGIFDLYAYYTGIAREEVRDALIARLDVQGSIPKPEHIPAPVVAEVPPTDIASRSDTYTGLLSKLTLASDHRQNLRNRGLSDEEIDRLGNHSGGRDANHCKAASIQRILSVRCTRLLPKRREMVLCL